MQQNSHVVGTYFLEELSKLRDEFEIVGDIRGKGLMIGVEMVEDKVTRLSSSLNFFTQTVSSYPSKLRGKYPG